MATTWLLTIVPLTCSLLLHMILGPQVYIYIITLILNVIFLIIDYRQAKKEPLLHASWHWIVAGLLFIPAYLYFTTIRPEGKKTYKYIVVWGIIYIADLALLSMF